MISNNAFAVYINCCKLYLSTILDVQLRNRMCTVDKHYQENTYYIYTYHYVRKIMKTKYILKYSLLVQLGMLLKCK